jgi:hypothetical protein
MADTFASFNRKLDDFRSELDGTKLKAKLEDVGKAAKGDAAKALAADIGDQSMSNWWRGRPINLAARYELKGDSSIEVTPAPRARGPWRVLEDGRRGGSATDLVLVGRVRKKSGTRRARSRGRNQGATAGKNTWSDAVQIMERETPKRVDRYVVEAAIRKSGV